MCFILLRVLIWYETEILLGFLIASHTKNRCSAAFGIVKRRLKQCNVFGTTNMMQMGRF